MANGSSERSFSLSRCDKNCNRNIIETVAQCFTSGYKCILPALFHRPCKSLPAHSGNGDCFGTVFW